MKTKDIIEVISILLLISIATGLITLFISAALILAPILAIAFGVMLLYTLIKEHNEFKRKKRKQ